MTPPCKHEVLVRKSQQSDVNVYLCSHSTCVYCFSSSTFLNELVEDKIKGFPISGMSYAEEVTQLGTLAIVSRQTFDL